MDNIQIRARGMTDDRDCLPYEEQLYKLLLFSLEKDKRIEVYIRRCGKEKASRECLCIISSYVITMQHHPKWSKRLYGF